MRNEVLFMTTVEINIVNVDEFIDFCKKNSIYIFTDDEFKKIRDKF